MKLISITTCAMLVATLSLTGCIGQTTIHARAFGPTEDEAKQLAKAQLDEQARGHKVMTNVAYKTKAVPQANGGTVYEASAAERIK